MANNLIIYYSRKGENYCNGSIKKLLKGNTEIVAEFIQDAVCGPCWWGTYPMAVFTQLEKLNWKGKNVIALMTHEGSGLGSCESDLKRICTGATFGKGLAVHGASALNSEDIVSNWAKGVIK